MKGSFDSGDDLINIPQEARRRTKLATGAPRSPTFSEGLHPATAHSITAGGELPRTLSWCLEWS